MRRVRDDGVEEEVDFSGTWEEYVEERLDRDDFMTISLIHKTIMEYDPVLGRRVVWQY